MEQVILLLVLTTAASGQYLFQHQQPIAIALQQSLQPVHSAPQTTVPLAHQAVIENSISESQLPMHLIRSKDFLRNPKTADALAKDSWLTNKEMPVFHREADDISRDEIYKIFKNAGFLHS